MSRWPPGTQTRLQRAALEMFEERGYHAATVAAIAERADLTERTFFRHFSDKQEVLFAGQERLTCRVVDALRAAPACLAPLDATTVGLVAAAAFFEEEVGRAISKTRQDVLDAHPELQERELAKMAGLSTAIERALQNRGTSTAAAAIVAGSAVAAFRFAFSCWVEGSNPGTLEGHFKSTIGVLQAVARGA